MEEKRKRQRVPFRSSIEILTKEGKKTFEGLENISMDGFLVMTNHQFEKDEECEFDLTLMCGDNKINILGVCVASRFEHPKGEEVEEGEECIGFKIIHLEPESSEELFNVIKYNVTD